MLPVFPISSVVLRCVQEVEHYAHRNDETAETATNGAAPDKVWPFIDQSIVQGVG
jgi:hypothetical protein